MTTAEKLGRRIDGSMKLKIDMDDEKRLWIEYYCYDNAGVLFPWEEPEVISSAEFMEALELYYTILENLNITSKEYPLYKERILEGVKELNIK